MDLSSYRAEYAGYASAFEHERYRHHAGIAQELHFEHIRDRFCGLWTHETIDELKNRLSDTPAQFETERNGISALLTVACRNHIGARAAEITSELERCSASSYIELRGEKIMCEDAPVIIAHEADAGRRSELASRWLDSVHTCDDLRATRLETIREAARALGFAGLGALEESASGVAMLELISPARKFLEATSSAYMSGLASRAAQDASSEILRPVSFADALRFRRAAHIDAFFPQRRALTAYRAMLEGLGIRAERQKNITFDDAPRLGKKNSTLCFHINPPTDVRLVIDEQIGAESYLKLFFEGGRAQHFAWASHDMATRYPEFVHAPDTAAQDAAGHLFVDFLRDAGWVGESFGLRVSEAHALSRSVALLQLEEARHSCAGLQYALALDDAPDIRSDHLAEIYVSLYGEATGVRYHTATRLIDAEDAFRHATKLRARLLAVSLKDHLRTRYGRRWYASRAAGDQLIDVWNAASRYHAEELARLAWGGELSFDLLAEDLKAALDEK